jgi:hypothetical protein
VRDSVTPITSTIKGYSPPLARMGDTAEFEACFHVLSFPPDSLRFEGCAVVGEDGAIITNLSVADVRNLADAVVLAGEDEAAVLGASIISVRCSCAVLCCGVLCCAVLRCAGAL